MSEFTPDPAVETAADGTQAETMAVPEQAAEPAAAEAVPEEKAAEAPEVPLAWHRFLTRFYLWLAALYHFARAALVFTGWNYHSITARDAVYAGLPKMQQLDLSFGGMLALGALLQIISACMLHKKQAKGTRTLPAAYLILLLAQLGYGAGRYLLTGLTPFTGSNIALSAAYICLMAVNGSYYRKRRSIFNL